jgi:hypothetical protein
MHTDRGMNRNATAFLSQKAMNEEEKPPSEAGPGKFWQAGRRAVERKISERPFAHAQPNICISAA